MRMMMTAAVAAMTLMGQAAQAEPQEFTIDPTHASVGFLVGHLGYYDQLGMFTDVSGSFTFDIEAGELSALTVIIKTGSVFTGHEARDNHLRGADFFNVGEHPEMTFTMTGVEKTGDNTGAVTGDLTLLGETRAVTVDATFNKAGVYPFGHKKMVVGVDGALTLDRTDYGMTYASNPGGVGNEIKIMLGMEGIINE